MPEIQPVRHEPSRINRATAIVRAIPHAPGRLYKYGENKAVQTVEHVLERQMGRGRITSTQAAAYRQEILDGGVNYFLQDSAIGSVVSWTMPKLVTPGLAFWLVQQGMPEAAGAIAAYDFLANPFSTPYFAFRAIQEYRHSKAQLAEKEDLSEQDQKIELRRRAAVLAGITTFNLIPVPPIPWLPGATMSYYRNEGLSKTVATYHWDNLKDSRVGRTVSKIVSTGKDVGRAIDQRLEDIRKAGFRKSAGNAGREMLRILTPPDL